MSQSSSTEAAENSTGGHGSTATMEQPPQLRLDTIAVPDSPASLWTSVSRSRIAVDCVDCVPAELRDWVAPAVIVHASH